MISVWAHKFESERAERENEFASDDHRHHRLREPELDLHTQLAFDSLDQFACRCARQTRGRKFNYFWPIRRRRRAIANHQMRSQSNLLARAPNKAPLFVCLKEKKVQSVERADRLLVGRGQSFLIAIASRINASHLDWKLSI